MAKVPVSHLVALCCVVCLIVPTVESLDKGNYSCVKGLGEAPPGGGVRPVLKKDQAAWLLIVGFGGFSLTLALLHRGIRKYIYYDENKLDTAFDAGGNITWSLTAVTVASQFFWPGDILHSATLAVKIGVAGPFWYTIGVMANILAFPVFSVSLKTRAPGAKTYLQIFRARYGRVAHLVFCCFAMATSLMIIISTLLAGKAMMKSLVEDVSDEFIILVMAFLFGSYSLVGGLGTTFYVSYFNACLVFVLLITFAAKIWYIGPADDRSSGVGNFTGDRRSLYDAISCLKGPDGNTELSYLTFQSNLGLLYGSLSLFLGTSSTYCDQALWQSRIAAKPLQGVWGFFIGGLIWFTVPMTMASATGLGYLAMSYANGTHLLNPDQINEGLVTPMIAERLLGQTGGVMILVMGTMAVMSTGSGEVMGVSSIIVYDIYQVYIRPFRKSVNYICCILCGKQLENGDPIDTDIAHQNHGREESCSCISVEKCQDCAEDMEQKPSAVAVNAVYKCPIHGSFRVYQDHLVRVKNWCILLVTLSLVPFGLLILESGINLNWIFYCGSVVIIPCFFPVIMCVAWSKATGIGLISGAVSGLVAGVSSGLIAASTLDGGLGNFLTNTADEFSITVGSYTGFVVTLVVCIVVSLFTHKIKTDAAAEAEWEKTRRIDNPLNPWHVYYKPELERIGVQYSGRPTKAHLERAFKPAKSAALVGGSVIMVLTILILPGVMSMFSVLSYDAFSGWMTFCHVWVVVIGIIVVCFPPVEEIFKVLKQRRSNMEKKYITRDTMNTHLGQNEIITSELQFVNNSGI